MTDFFKLTEKSSETILKSEKINKKMLLDCQKEDINIDYFFKFN